MKKLDFGGRLDFSDIDLTAPDIVIAALADQLSDATNHIVQGIVAPYEGQATSSVQRGIAGIAAVLGTTDPRSEIQKSLGRQGEEDHRYEFYLNTPLYTSYKYRVCFFRYGIANYPVKVMLEQGIADAVYSEPNASYIISCKNRDELEALMIKVLYSKRVIDVMQELIRIYQIKKQSDSQNNGECASFSEENVSY